MKSVRFDRLGEPADVLRVEDVPVPRPGPGELLVRLTARPINPSDLLYVRGRYGTKPQMPATPGFEGAGVVEALGPGVGGWEVGQRVIPQTRKGTWQELATADAGRSIPVAAEIDDATAAQFVVNPLTAWVMTADVLGVRPGQWLLQTAAGSALGRVVAQLGRVQGFHTINVIRRRDQEEELRRLGGDEIICTADEDLGERVRAITGGAGVPAAIDAVGGRLGAEVAGVLSVGGTMVAYGVLAGEPTPLDYGGLIFRSATVRGFWLTDWFRTAPPDAQQTAVARVMGLLAGGEVKLAVEATYPLADVAEAVRHAERSGRGGKVLLVG